MPEQTLKAYSLTVKRQKKLVRKSFSTEIARATIFNFIGTVKSPNFAVGEVISPSAKKNFGADG